jgi:hypothetical protein
MMHNRDARSFYGFQPGSWAVFEVHSHGCVSLLLLVDQMPPHVCIIARVFDAAGLLRQAGLPLRDCHFLSLSTSIFSLVSISTSQFLLHTSWACGGGCFIERTQHSELSTTKLRASSSRGFSGRSEEQQFVEIGVKGCPLQGAEEYAIG